MMNYQKSLRGLLIDSYTNAAQADDLMSGPSRADIHCAFKAS